MFNAAKRSCCQQFCNIGSSFHPVFFSGMNISSVSYGLLKSPCKHGNRHFWCRGYYVDTVGKYENAIKEYIKNQLQDDIMNDQISMKELIDPFTGEQEKKGK